MVVWVLMDRSPPRVAVEVLLLVQQQAVARGDDDFESSLDQGIDEVLHEFVGFVMPRGQWRFSWDRVALRVFPRLDVRHWAEGARYCVPPCCHLVATLSEEDARTSAPQVSRRDTLLVRRPVWVGAARRWSGAEGARSVNCVSLWVCRPVWVGAAVC